MLAARLFGRCWLAVLLAQPSAGLVHAPTLARPVTGRQHGAVGPVLDLRPKRSARMMAAGVPTTSQPVEGEGRLPYVLSGLPRSRFRGSAMGWLHKTRSWYLLSALYVALAFAIGRRAGNPLSATGLTWRALAAAATSANVFISDRYHNPDKRLRAGRSEAYTASAETWALRCDYVGISSVLTTQLWLWSANMGWMHALSRAGVVSGLATLFVAAVARLVVPRKVGHVLVKATMGGQFAVLLGYLAWTVLNHAPLACRVSIVIFFTYMPGLVVYALKKPKSAIFGFHEWFHTSVLAGHTLSMLFDLRDIATPCLGGLCAL